MTWCKMEKCLDRNQSKRQITVQIIVDIIIWIAGKVVYYRSSERMRWINGWISCNFTSFLTVFQSKDNRRVTMKECVRRNPMRWGFKCSSRVNFLSLDENVYCDPSLEPSLRV